MYVILQVLRIREFSFHEVNANLLWPGTITFAQWLLDHVSLLEGRRILELGRLAFSVLFFGLHVRTPSCIRLSVWLRVLLGFWHVRVLFSSV